MAPKTEEQLQQIRQDQRQKITNTALKLFAKDGFAKTTIGKIASEAGVSKGLIYHYFSSKEAILVAIFEGLQEMGRQVTDFPEEKSPVECLRQMLERTFSYIENEPEIMRFMVSLSIQPDAVAKIRPYIQKENERQLDLMKNLLAQIGYDDPAHEAYYLGAKLDGLVMGYITMGDDYPYEPMKQKILNEYVFDQNHT